MRNNQVSILIERFNDSVPKDYPASSQRIKVYVDNYTNVFAALAKAYALAIDKLSEFETISHREDIYTNENEEINKAIKRDEGLF